MIDLVERSPLRDELVRLDRRLLAFVTRLAARARAPGVLAEHVVEPGEAIEILRELAIADDARELAASPDGPKLAPMRELARRFALTPLEIDAVLLALAVECDARYARVFAYINEHVGRPRPTVGLAVALSAGTQPLEDSIASFLPAATLRYHAILDCDGDGPLPSRGLVLADDLWPRLAGLGGARPGTLADRLRLDDIVIFEAAAADIARAAMWLKEQRERRPLLVIHARADLGRATLARALAGELGLATIAVTTDADAGRTIRDAIWYDAALVLGPEVDAARFDAAPVPLIAWGERRAHDLHVQRPTFELALGPIGVRDRTRLWARSASVPEDVRGDLAARFRFGPGQIGIAGARAMRHCAIPDREALHACCREIQRVSFGNLAAALPPTDARDELVLPQASREDFELALVWARHGHVLPRRSALDTGGQPLLFRGPPGTGKTMAARLVATRLGLTAYRVDLSNIVNKYIGETEKNLARVFDEASSTDVVLFFDEAETLFGRRTDVQSANDRYANLETGYLLQRLESHPGVAILATNLFHNLDDAFLRRFRVIVDFPLPGRSERAAIWTAHLAATGLAPPDLDLKVLSDRFELSGAEIVNAIYTAILLAREDGSAATMKHLVNGVARELRKAGRMIDPAMFGVWANALAGVKRTR